MKKVVRLLTDQETGMKQILFQCPGCDQTSMPSNHLVPVKLAGEKVPGSHKGKPIWDWDGSTESPTLRPSIRISAPGYCCHFFMRQGRIEFCGDCSHSYKGKTYQLPEIKDA